MSSDLTVEEISEEIQRLAAFMAHISASRSPLFQRLADRILKTARPEVLAGWRGLLEQLDPKEREPMRQLLVLHRQQRELHQRLRLQKRYKNLLEVWLYLHLHLSVVLVLLIAAHVVAVFYFGAV